MLEDHVGAAITRRRLYSGPAANHVDNFAEWLHNRGHNKRSVFRKLQSFAAWTDWLTKTGRSTTDFLEGLDACTRYVLTESQFPYQRGPKRESLSVVRLFLCFLREQGTIQAPVDSSIPPYPLVVEFRAWMLEHRGVTKSTLDVYQRILDEFIASAGSDPHRYSPQALRGFVVERGSRHGSSYASLGGTAVRSFLRFLGATGQCKPGLEFALPACASRESSSLPRFLTPDVVNRIIASCPADGAGTRDKAVLLLLARLGLRAGDIVGLRLSDVDWTNARIKVCGKGRRHDFLPLQHEVGKAILRYLKAGRPTCKTPALFVTIPPPFTKLSYQAVSGIVRRALERANVKAPVSGAHVLRHSAATAMLRQGASLASIGLVLRHRSPQTTARYAKVDLGMLSTIAQPWLAEASC